MSDSGDSSHWHVVPTRSTRSKVASAPTETLTSTATPVVPTPTPSIPDSKAFRRLFTRVYNKWSRSETVAEEERSSVMSMHVSEKEFLKVTENRECSKYIALIDYHIRFDELPLRPHGQIIGYMVVYLSGVFQATSQENVLFAASDNDVRLDAGTIKRPDASFGIRPRALPNPPPAWLRFLPNGEPYPNVVVEVAVNHEGPAKLRADCHRYFSNTTSVCVWIGIKVWVADQKFWVGWADRAANGNRAMIHTNMRFPPHHYPINTPVNLVYHIPMQTVYGNGIATPSNSPATLDIDCDQIRDIIREFLEGMT